MAVIEKDGQYFYVDENGKVWETERIWSKDDQEEPIFTLPSPDGREIPAREIDEEAGEFYVDDYSLGAAIESAISDAVFAILEIFGVERDYYEDDFDEEKGSS